MNFGKFLRTPFFIHRTPLVAVQKLIYMTRQTFSFFLLKPIITSISFIFSFFFVFSLWVATSVICLIFFIFL